MALIITTNHETKDDKKIFSVLDDAKFLNENGPWMGYAYMFGFFNFLIECTSRTFIVNEVELYIKLNIFCV